MDKRQKTKKMIIEKSKETFLQKGLFNTVMDDIAKSSNLSRRTLYRYFKTKEDLAYETTIDLLDEWNNYQVKVFKSLKGNGIERLYTFLNLLIDYMTDKRDVMKYLGEFDFYFKDESQNLASEDSLKRFNEIILKSEDLLSSIITLGKNDKSIKEKTDINLTVSTISNVLWSFGQRIAIRGKAIKKESGLDPIDLIKNQVHLYIKALEV